MSALSHSIPSANSLVPYLVADIGGTNARFSIAQWQSDLVLEHAVNYRVEEFNNISAALIDYIQKLPVSLKPQRAVLAVASAVTSDEIRFTNSPWHFSISALQQQLLLEKIDVINDFAAVAWALPALQHTELHGVGSVSFANLKKPGVYVVLGPGTGLGVAALKTDDNGSHTIIETEGGHINFAPRSESEITIFRILQKQFQRVSYERLLSGNGLVNLYRARSEMLGLHPELNTAAEVSAAARESNAPAASLAAQDFCSILGAFAGDTALMFGAWSGVYLAGGLLPHLLNEKGRALFRAAFQDKGRFSYLLEQTPVAQITRSDVGNLGAANFAFQSPTHLPHL
jgi:glucokinase